MAPFDPSVHTNEKAEHDAEALYKSGEGKWGTDEEGFTKIVLSSPPEHLAAIDAIYGNKYASSIKDAVEKEFSGDAKDALTFYGACIATDAGIAERLGTDTTCGGTRGLVIL